jgi:two-component system heavy metal sensor histidine kinase CusS
MKFRSRLVGAVSGVTVITLGGAFFAVFQLMNREQQRQLDVALLAEAHQEAREAARGGDGHTLMISDGPGPYGNDIGPLTKYGAIFAADGTVLSATETYHGHAPALERIRHPSDECFDLWFHREHLRAVLTDVPRHPGNLLMLAAPRLDLDSDAAFLRRAMAIVFLVAVGWAVLLATWIVKRLTRGHAAVARVARHVADGDLSARVVPDPSDPEMAQLGQDVNQMIDRLSQLLRAQEEFITHAAHELRSPLTTLNGELALALRKARDPESYRKAIEEALASAQGLKGLAENLLTMARIGAADEPREQVWLNEVIERARRGVAAEAAQKGVHIDVEDEACVVTGNGRDLERLFCNLLENAIRHSPSGGRVRVLLARWAESVLARVVDEGEGVAAEDRERIFEPFYRSPKSYGTAGYGLGLAIARKIASAHGGRLTLGSDDKGASFNVELPALDLIRDA